MPILAPAIGKIAVITLGTIVVQPELCLDLTVRAGLGAGSSPRVGVQAEARELFRVLAFLDLFHYSRRGFNYRH